MAEILQRRSEGIVIDDEHAVVVVHGEQRREKRGDGVCEGSMYEVQALHVPRGSAQSRASY